MVRFHWPISLLKLYVSVRENSADTEQFKILPFVNAPGSVVHIYTVPSLNSIRRVLELGFSFRCKQFSRPQFDSIHVMRVPPLIVKKKKRFTTTSSKIIPKYCKWKLIPPSNIPSALQGAYPTMFEYKKKQNKTAKNKTKTITTTKKTNEGPYFLLHPFSPQTWIMTGPIEQVTLGCWRCPT